MIAAPTGDDDGSRDRGTPETRAKLDRAPDEIDRLLRERRGGISQAEYDAAAEIARAFRLITGELGVKPMRWQPGGFSRSFLFSDELPEHPSVKRYLLWAREMMRRRRSVNLVLDCVVDGRPVSERHLEAALRLYLFVNGGAWRE